jgi:hypothetical protein
MVGVLIAIATLALGAFILHRMAVEWGGDNRSFWECVAAMFIARAVSKLPILIDDLGAPGRLALGFGLYSMVLVVFLASFAKVPFLRALLGGVGLAILVFVASIIALMTLVSGEPG